MITITVLAKSSSGAPYEVTFVTDETGDRWRMDCACEAGQKGIHCKHRIDFLINARTLLHDPAQNPLLDEAHRLPGTVRALDRLITLFAQMNQTEKEIEKIKKVQKGIKRQVAELLAGR